MVQKKAAAKAKSPQNGVAKKAQLKTPKKAQKGKKIEIEEDEEVKEVIAAPVKAAKGKKVGIKPASPVKKVAVKEDASEEESEENEDEGSDDELDNDNGNASDDSKLIDDEASEAEENEDADSDDDEGSDDDEDGEVPVFGSESDDNDNEPPVEISSKAQPEVSAKTNTQYARITEDTPKENIVYVKNLPGKYKFLDLIQLFAKFGTIASINRPNPKSNRNYVYIAYTDAKSAESAIAAKDLVLDGTNIEVTSSAINYAETNGRTVIVSCMGPSVTIDQLKTHFADCGEVEQITLSKNKFCPVAYILFQNIESVPKAVKLNNSTLNDRIINVRSKSQASNVQKSSEHTLVISNTVDAESYNDEELAKIFKKYGAIENIEILCTKSILAFLTYKDEKSAKAAYEALNDKTINGLELRLEFFSTQSTTRTTVVNNLSSGVTEEDLKKVFSDSGEIEQISIKNSCALIKFKTIEGFCKSFLQHETKIKGNRIYLEPKSKIRLIHKGHSRPNFKNNFKGKTNSNFSPNRVPHFKNNAGPRKPAGKFQKPNPNAGPGQFKKRPAQQGDNVPHFYKRAKTA